MDITLPNAANSMIINASGFILLLTNIKIKIEKAIYHVAKSFS